VVAELLGHAKVTLTLDTYSHVSPALLDQAAQRMESIIAEAPAVTLRR
jgi:site-specific recombinase XerD